MASFIFSLVFLITFQTEIKSFPPLYNLYLYKINAIPTKQEKITGKSHVALGQSRFCKRAFRTQGGSFLFEGRPNGGVGFA